MSRFRISRRPISLSRLGGYLLDPLFLLVLVGILLLSLAPPLWATDHTDDDRWTGVSAPLTSFSFAGGSGTDADPYLVATAEHLNNVRDHLDAHFRQTANIDLGVAPWSSGEGWAPMGTSLTPFTGSYDGNGYAIRNLTISRPKTSYHGHLHRRGWRNLWLLQRGDRQRGPSPGRPCRGPGDDPGLRRQEPLSTTRDAVGNLSRSQIHAQRGSVTPDRRSQTGLEHQNCDLLNL